MVQQPIRFCVVGNGQAFKKYWVKEQNKTVQVVSVIGVETPEEFSKSNTGLENIYYQSNNHSHTIEILEETTNYEAIALIVPTKIKLEILKKILRSKVLLNKKVFIEKPYTEDIAEILEYKKLIREYPNKIHLACKYSAGRADILYSEISKLKDTPLNITCNMIEGTKYFKNLSPQYLKDGPELDIGFHMIDIVAKYILYKLGNYEGINIIQNSVKDLREINKVFLKNYGFAADVEFIISGNKKISVSLNVGKAGCNDNRQINFKFNDFIISQEYSTENNDDPVLLIKNNKEKILLSKHIEGYNYYMRELQRDIFCKQSYEELISNLNVNLACINLKRLRLKH